MNAGKLRRAIDRHLFMKDRPVYREFLEHVKKRGKVWMASQGEIARWWEARQRAALDISFQAGIIRVSCPLPGAVAEIDGSELVPLPLELATVTSAGEPLLSISCPPDAEEFVRELSGHLGYMHAGIVREGAAAGIPWDEIEDDVRVLRNTAVKHWRYDADSLASLRKRLAAAHRRSGLPDIRIWNMPHSGGVPYTAGLSARYDVDKAIGLLPSINELEARYGLRSTAYLRPMGMFYGEREIKRYAAAGSAGEIALHGEFVTTSQKRFRDEFEAARGERAALEEMTGSKVEGVCMHGGELRSNTTPDTRAAVEEAGFLYETMFRNGYHLPLHLPSGKKVNKTLSIGQHFADVSIPPDRDFTEKFLSELVKRFDSAAEAGGFFVPVLHPLYFDVARYFANPLHIAKLIGFLPAFAGSVLRMKKGQEYVNRR